ncbi:hypothetical protein BT63DRAFT_189043 [Microthyrium microscopicum]|uniref:Chitin-binding type-2 domain-containing protein n=1 Tax=Microthyrium microscopicum TaxID=703497 RepID=A0A6A6UKZ4_9PEZI|nr:hypothetical protein BT63DRAFT_189043 [Microthyrium microscopicum]
MKIPSLLTTSMSMLLLALPHTTSSLINTDYDINANQHPIILNSIEPTGAPAPHSTLGTSTSSSATCDFAPYPTGCGVGDVMPCPFNCTMFYLCTSWGPLMQSCPNGTLFDLGESKCVLKNQTACTGCCMTTDCDGK